MSHKIAVSLDSVSAIRSAASEIRAYAVWAERRTREIAQKLSEAGIYEASIRFANAMYDGTNNVKLRTEESSNGDTFTFTIYAEGSAVCFIEFGAGVYYNSAAYPLDKPEGVVGIGEYGKGKGKQNYWGFYGENPGSNGWVIQGKKGPVVITQGNPAAMPMYYTVNEMKRLITTIAREVFLS